MNNKPVVERTVTLNLNTQRVTLRDIVSLLDAAGGLSPDAEFSISRHGIDSATTLKFTDKE